MMEGRACSLPLRSPDASGHSGFQHHLDGGVGLVLNGEPFGGFIQAEGVGYQGWR